MATMIERTCPVCTAMYVCGYEPADDDLCVMCTAEEPEYDGPLYFPEYGTPAFVHVPRSAYLH